jgi:hypothetical protein
MPGNLRAGVYWVDVTERQGVVARDAGRCVLIADLETQRTDCRKTARIIMKVWKIG